MSADRQGRKTCWGPLVDRRGRLPVTSITSVHNDYLSTFSVCCVLEKLQSEKLLMDTRRGNEETAHGCKKEELNKLQMVMRQLGKTCGAINIMWPWLQYPNSIASFPVLANQWSTSISSTVYCKHSSYVTIISLNFTRGNVRTQQKHMRGIIKLIRRRRTGD